MFGIVNLLLAPLYVVSNKKRKSRQNAFLAEPPPPVDTPKQWEFGDYCWKVTVESRNIKTNDLDRTFIGYSQNMNISERTKTACERNKTSKTRCGEPTMVMKGGECKEVIFMKLEKDGKLINLTHPYF